MATRQLFVPQWLGYAPGSGCGSTTFNLNSSAGAIGMCFIPQISGTLNSVRFYLSSVAGGGALTAAQLTGEIQTDSSGSPSGSNPTGGAAQACTATPAIGFNTVSGFTCSLSAATPYWFICKNTNGVPGTNFPTFQYFNIGGLLSSPLVGELSNAGQSVFAPAVTTFNGTTWASGGRSNFPNIRLDWADGGHEGFPCSATGSTSSTIVQGGGTPTEIGAQFTLPGTSNLTYKVAGLAFSVVKSGTPAGFPQGRIYLGSSTTPSATTQPAGSLNINATAGNAGDYVALYFTSTQSITGGQSITITLSDSASETGSNGYKINYNVMDSDVNSAFAPFEDTYQQAVLSAGAWTYTANNLPLMALLLDSTGEFTAAAGGGGLLVNPGMVGGCHG